jgi:hypothetical protein
MDKNIASVRKNYFFEFAIVIIFSFVSFYRSGFYFGYVNNVFHIPYVLDLASSPEFINDKLYQSLKYFTSLVWPLLRLIINENNVYSVFYYADIITRLLTFLAVLYLVKANGVTKKIETVLCFSLFACTPWLQESSIVGWHDLFTNFFSHSPVTWPFLLLALLFLQRNDLTKTSIMIGIVFNINAFVGIWLVFISFVTVIFDRQSYSISTIIKSCLLCALVSLPGIIWIGAALRDTWTAEKINYIEYFRLYFPNHFLIEAASFADLCKLVTIFACGILSCKFIEHGRYWIGIQIGCFILFAVGMPLPYIFNSKLIYNLHLLRSDGIEQFVAMMLTIIVAAKLISKTDSIRNNTIGAVIVFFLVFPYKDGKTDISLLFIVIALVSAIILNYYQDDRGSIIFNNKLFSFFKKYITSKYIPLSLVILWYIVVASLSGFDPNYSKYSVYINVMVVIAILYLLIVPIGILNKSNNRRLLFICLSAMILLSSVIGIKHTVDAKEKYVKDNADWKEFTQRIRRSDFHGIFLLAYSNKDYIFKYNDTYNNFQLVARRQVWADWKQGAAGMWDPNYIKTWMSRFKDIQKLKTSKEMLDYAIKNNIDYFVLNDNLGCPSLSETVLNVGEYSLCKPSR